MSTTPLPEEPLELGELTHDAVTGRYRIWQRKRGHRYSLDDVLTAWEAAQAAPSAQRCLDLGSGIGSVLLMLAHKLPEARLCAVEAQRNSFCLLTRNVRENALSDRTDLLQLDLRNLQADAFGAAFDLITGTPPYFLPGKATPSGDSQRAFARVEYRGGVEAYLDTAGKLLAPHGRVVVCADALRPERVLGHAPRAHLRVIARRDIVARDGHKGPLFSLFTLQHAEASPLPYRHLPAWYARDRAGRRTAEYLAARQFFGLPSQAS